MLSDETVAEAQDFIADYPASFIGGSYLVNPTGAKDIDIVVPAWEHDESAFVQSGYTKFCHEDDSKYADDELQRIVGTYRKGDINLLVIKPVYYPAYLGAAAAMTRQPAAYMQRDERINLHVQLCKAVKLIAQGRYIDAEEAPEGDLL